MQTHNLTQGSPEWHAYRAQHFNASDAPAMMGVSPYKTRSELLKEYATGISKEIDAPTKKRFDDGHRFEALARGLAETIVGDDLYPVTGSMGELSASFDGLTMCEDVVFEHKSLNNEIRGVSYAEELGEHLRIQMEQQLLISGAEKCLFMASLWDECGELIEEKHFWYLPDEDLRARIVAGWVQFKKDLADYQHVEVIEPARAEPVADLPVVTVQVRGELTMCNLDDVTPHFDRFLIEAKIELKTDEDFALAEAQAKKGREAAKQCKLTAKAVVDQMMSVAQVTRTLEDYAAKFDAMALKQEKAVTQQKDARKTAAKLERDHAYTVHIAALNDEIAPLRLVLADADKPNFVEAMKNQRTLASLYNKLDTELARAKIAADAAAAAIRATHAWYSDEAKGFEHLFADLQSLINRGDMEFFQLAVKNRIADHKIAEEKRREAERTRIQAEEQIKAEAAAAETLRRERETIEARAKQEEKAAEIARQNEEEDARRQREYETLLTQELKSAPASNPDRASQAWPFPPNAKSVAAAPTLTLGKISTRLGFSLTADFLRSIGFEAAGRERSAVLYRESDWPMICDKLIAHINGARIPQQQAA